MKILRQPVLKSSLSWLGSARRSKSDNAAGKDGRPAGDEQAPTLTASAAAALTAEALCEAREELRRLSLLSISIQEDERRRIALDLHDGLGQSLSLLKLSIEKAARLLAEGGTTEAGEFLRQLAPRVDQALAEVRRVSTQLRPSMLDDLGMLPTLSWFFREFEAAGAGIVLEKSIKVAEADVPVALRITIFRIIQEAFHNIVKHSAADRVRIRLDRIGNGLQLQIADNGCGFDPAAIEWIEGTTRGLGLLGMRERASASGGTYHLHSAPGHGTSISVRWLLRPEKYGGPGMNGYRPPPRASQHLRG